ncbi:unnamed protein product [Adineta ricciae]|uniref:Uncharacterized protein n=1 Tax=Adineta ricciae TaxID=249248 RepID=A0A814FV23_ADIRI|nr:unnamed protein product [Adineta ricciae]
MIKECADSASHIVYHHYSNRKLSIILIGSVSLVCILNVFPFKTITRAPLDVVDSKTNKLQSPFSRTLAFIRLNGQRPERLRVLENYRPFFINLHYSMPQYTSVINYTADGWLSGDDPYKAVSETMKVLLKNYPMAWINPFQFDQMNYKNIWLAGQASSYICGGHSVGSKWIYWNNDSLRAVQNAKKTLTKQHPNRFITDENIMCGGWTDIYYIPRRFFQDFIYLSDAFHQSRSFHEIGIPTMFNMIDLTYRSTPFHTVITHLEDCWGNCCSYGANANEINTKRCGHKIDLANDQVVKVLINLLNSEAYYLHKTTPKKSNNQSDASFQVKIIRMVLKKAERYASATMGEGLAGNTVAKVLRNIDRTLGPLGLNYWVSMEQFASAAVRVGLSRQVGIAVYHVVDFFAPIGK